MTDHPNYQQVLAALRADPERLIEWAAVQIVCLGAKLEWDNEDNYQTTESLVGLTTLYGPPSAGGQDEEEHRFYGEAAIAMGFETDWEDEDDDEDEWDGEAQECFDGCGLAVDHEPPCREKPGGRVLTADSTGRVYAVSNEPLGTIGGPY